MNSKAYLTLENGRVFEGTRFGADADAIGEVVFTTGMTGCLETVTDKANYGKIVLQTFPIAGCYGVIPEDFESEAPQLRAFIVKEACGTPSNFRSKGALPEYLAERGVPGLCGFDTRALAKVLRDDGTMNGLLSSEPATGPDALAAIKAHRERDPVGAVTCRERVAYAPPAGMGGGEPARRVALLDLGAKDGVIRELLSLGCEVIKCPAGTTAGEIIGLRPDGAVIAGGPGDPRDCGSIVAEIRALMQNERKMPVFGIGLGHLLLAIACGAGVARMKHGHRGACHPVRDIASGRVYVTSQSHGFVADLSGVAKEAGVITRFVNVNDGTCEGIDCLDYPAFSVQFNPEACAGPRDAAFLFGRFASLMDKRRSKEADRHAT